MTKEQIIVQDVLEKYGEWFETYPDDAPFLLIHILANRISRQEDQIEFYRRSLKWVH